MAARKKPVSKRQSRIVFAAVLALTAGVFLIGISELRHADDALAGRGRPGTFTAQRQDCGRSNCTWHGEFLQDDGTSRPDVQVAQGSGLQAAGDVVRAADVGDPGTVYPLRQQTRRDALATILGTGTVLLGFLLAGVAAVRRRRLPPRTPAQRIARLGLMRVVILPALAAEAFGLAWMTDGRGPWLFGALGLFLAWLAVLSVRAMLAGRRSLGV